jgi:pescadillo protein
LQSLWYTEANKGLGIYPREPRNKKKAARGATPSTTFYYTKDIQYLLHEPLIQRFRDHKSIAKKIGKALGRGETGDASRLEKSIPRMRLDHIVKERYPTFVDALRDLDDALSMLFLFANLPSTATVPPKTIALCQRLCLEFEHYLIVSHSLRKSFLSIKGIYYQATVQGQDILWLVPYKFVQRTAGDIDFRIMGTFVDFYTTLLGFVNYRLYTSIGLVYPPKFDAARDDQGAELGAFTLEGKQISTGAESNGVNGHETFADMEVDAQAEADKLIGTTTTDAETEDALDKTQENEGEKVNDSIDTFEPTSAPDADVLPQPQMSSTDAASLFADFTFFLGRETPRAPLEFLLKAFGCKRVGWDAVLGEGAFTTDEKDPAITHQVIDRPTTNVRVPGRTYIQPQWVWDCINQGKLLRPDLYAPGAVLPPHLSPWVKPRAGQYDPTAPLAEQEQEGEAELHEEEFAEEDATAIEAAEDEEDAEAAVLAEAENEDDEDDSDDDEDEDIEIGEGMDIELASSGSENEDDDDDAPADKWDGVSDDEDASELSEGEAERLQEQLELEAEATGKPLPAKPASTKSEARKKAEKSRKAKEEELTRQRMMLPNKKRKLFDKMTYGNKMRDVEAEKLRKKRRKLERGGAGAKA